MAARLGLYSFNINIYIENADTCIWIKTSAFKYRYLHLSTDIYIQMQIFVFKMQKVLFSY